MQSSSGSGSFVDLAEKSSQDIERSGAIERHAKRALALGRFQLLDAASFVLPCAGITPICRIRPKASHTAYESRILPFLMW